jgi:uncharacterized lipoprotein YajG
MNRHFFAGKQARRPTKSYVMVLGRSLLLLAGCAKHSTSGTTTTTLPSSTGTPVVVTSPGPSAAAAGNGAPYG